MSNWRGPHNIVSKEQDLWTTLCKTASDLWFIVRMFFFLAIFGFILVGIVAIFSG